MCMSAEILEHLLDASHEPPFRPRLDEIHSAPADGDPDSQKFEQRHIEALQAFVESCWAENALDRPTAAAALKDLGRVNPFK